MGSSGIEVTGIGEVIRRLEVLGDRAKAVESNAVLAGAKVLKETMSGNAPGPSQKQRVHLQDNIQVGRVRTRGGMKVVLVGPGPGAFYAQFLEFGTSKMSPRPFIGRSADEANGEVVSEMAATLRRGLGL
ncbi:HK97-gp10 family putative phage morphogenesis protein [Marininema halotolerans]|uniref:Phage protein, HK97 gp10 family n=1 Tax=Marininema halotolerans TaxID=1155944 RepID=A0A1I6URL9_9BACL|nr:HK97-gp10 family putative phage morphogenesis protein [Marininema halotolerans]SFT04099.1 phage protein, HK97 gp10 family [Marininema halotolerans]